MVYTKVSFGQKIVPKFSMSVLNTLLCLVIVASPGTTIALECSLQPLVGRFVSTNPAPIPSFETELDHKLTVAMIYTGLDDWNQMTANSMGIDAWINTPYKKVISVGMLPRSENPSAISSGASGAFDSHWCSFAQQLCNKFGQEEVYIRLGWEANLLGTWPWTVNSSNLQQWIQYWRRIVSIIKITLPNAKIVWCVGREANDGTSYDQNGILDTLAYPGDAYVDNIGIDTFDSWTSLASNPTNPGFIWNTYIYGRSKSPSSDGYVGLRLWSDFSNAHGKSLSIPEWGMVHQSAGNADPRSWGGDNAFYIQKMFEFISDPVNKVAFHVYTAHYHDAAEGLENNYRGINPMPTGMGEYKRLFAPYYNYCDTQKPEYLGRKLFILNANLRGR